MLATGVLDIRQAGRAIDRTIVMMIAAALAFVLPPLVGRVKPGNASRDAMNLVIYRERRQALEFERAAGELGDEQFAAACAELYLRRDMHFSPSGHDLFAREIARYLRASGLI